MRTSLDRSLDILPLQDADGKHISLRVWNIVDASFWCARVKDIRCLLSFKGSVGKKQEQEQTINLSKTSIVLPLGYLGAEGDSTTWIVVLMDDGFIWALFDTPPDGDDEESDQYYDGFDNKPPTIRFDGDPKAIRICPVTDLSKRTYEDCPIAGPLIDAQWEVRIIEL